MKLSNTLGDLSCEISHKWNINVATDGLPKPSWFFIHFVFLSISYFILVIKFNFPNYWYLSSWSIIREKIWQFCGYNSTEQSKLSDHRFKKPHSKPCIVHIWGSKDCMATSARLTSYIWGLKIPDHWKKMFWKKKKKHLLLLTSNSYIVTKLQEVAFEIGFFSDSPRSGKSKEENKKMSKIDQECVLFISSPSKVLYILGYATVTLQQTNSIVH